MVLLGLSLFGLSSLALFSTGCRGLSSTPSSPSPTLPVPVMDGVSNPGLQAPIPSQAAPSATPVKVYKPPVIADDASYGASFGRTTGGTDGLDAFRPISPEQFVTVQKPVSPSENFPHSQAKIDELNRRVAELESDLAKSEEKTRRVLEAQKAAEAALAEKNTSLPSSPAASPAMLPVAAVATEISKPVTEPTSKQVAKSTPRKAPTLNIPGVSVVTENNADRGEIRFRVTDKVLFVPGTYRIAPTAEPMLRRIAAEIRAIAPETTEAVSLEIEGHTDSLQVDPANPMQKHDISTVKSVVVMEYFVKSLLWNPEKIRTSAHGLTRPVADNGTPEGRIQNNRVEIVVLP